MKKLTFKNYYYYGIGGKKEPTVTELLLDDSCNYKPILSWYGAFHAGDPYEVYIDGVELELDLNGEIEPKTIDAMPNVKLIELNLKA